MANKANMVRGLEDIVLNLVPENTYIVNGVSVPVVGERYTFYRLVEDGNVIFTPTSCVKQVYDLGNNIYLMKTQNSVYVVKNVNTEEPNDSYILRGFSVPVVGKPYIGLYSENDEVYSWTTSSVKGILYLGNNIYMFETRHNIYAVKVFAKDN